MSKRLYTMCYKNWSGRSEAWDFVLVARFSQHLLRMYELDKTNIMF